MMMQVDEPIIKVSNLKKYFPVSNKVFGKTGGFVKAVDGVSFDIGKGETLGLAGESGCGKSAVARTMLRLYPATDGKVFYKDIDLFSLSHKKLQELRPKLQYIFQDPYSSLNPRMNIMQLIGEAAYVHSIVPKKDIHDSVSEILETCGLGSELMYRYPHELSGGQRQRIGIARALILNPDFIIGDEPVSALDVSIQSQIINLLSDLQEKLGFSFLFISHDLSVIRYISNRVGIMYLGSIVESGSKDDIFERAAHPYTKALLSAIPIPDPTVHRHRIILSGDMPSPVNPPSGCKFHTRCPECKSICKQEIPVLRNIGDNHLVACHFA